MTAALSVVAGLGLGLWREEGKITAGLLNGSVCKSNLETVHGVEITEEEKGCVRAQDLSVLHLLPRCT